MLQVKELIKPYINLAGDKRINVFHLSIYMALLYLCVRNNGINPVYISRKKVMKLAHISSIVTYHKCIKQLQEFGYIHYVPSYNCFLGSQVFLLSIPEDAKH